MPTNNDVVSSDAIQPIQTETANVTSVDMTPEVPSSSIFSSLYSSVVNVFSSNNRDALVELYAQQAEAILVPKDDASYDVFLDIINNDSGLSERHGLLLIELAEVTTVEQALSLLQKARTFNAEVQSQRGSYMPYFTTAGAMILGGAAVYYKNKVKAADEPVDADADNVDADNVDAGNPELMMTLLDETMGSNLGDNGSNEEPGLGEVPGMFTQFGGHNGHQGNLDTERAPQRQEPASLSSRIASGVLKYGPFVAGGAALLLSTLSKKKF